MCSKLIAILCISFYSVVVFSQNIDANASTKAPSLSVQTGHSQAINSLVFSLDNKKVISGSSDNKVIVCDLATGKQMFELLEHTGNVTCIGFLPSGNTLITAGEDKKVCFWSYPEFKLKKVIELRIKVKSMAINPIGSEIACAGGEVYIINTSSFEVVKRYLSEFD